MLRSYFCAIVLVLGATLALAHDNARLEIYEYGTYVIGPGVPEGKSREGFSYEHIAAFELTEATNTVIAQIGRTFGFRYKIVGEPTGQPIEVTIVFKFPREGVLPPNGQAPVVLDDYVVPKIIGEDAFIAWTFDRPSELVPGIWTIEIWQGQKKLGGHSFNVILPPIS